MKQIIGDLTIKMSMEAKKGALQGPVIGFSRTHPSYEHKQPAKDWEAKQLVERALRDHPNYGHKRLALHLKLNKKRILRVMKLFGIKPYRRTVLRVFQKPRDSVFPN